jgi:hypothetical protein
VKKTKKNLKSAKIRSRIESRKRRGGGGGASASGSGMGFVSAKWVLNNNGQPKRKNATGGFRRGRGRGRGKRRGAKK